jgi:hypothetical protein
MPANLRQFRGVCLGRAYMPLSRWVEPLIITPVVFLLLSLVTYVLSRRRSRGDSMANKEL